MNYPHVLAVLSQQIAARRHSIYCRRSAISHEAVPAEGGRHECPRDAPTDSDENEERRSECLVTARNALIPMDRHARVVTQAVDQDDPEPIDARSWT